jgi:HD-GYP domain-containing protein (c-di-GMP phosphodiesterase class II)
MEMGIQAQDLIFIRRGALLHDIGKIGIPDSILLKPGPLDDGERKIMRLHPVHAYNMLKSIQFLKPTLDIPYCHHEKWDGTGYPQQLEGDRIPFAARIFAITDVWDALSSNRSYRKAWDRQAVLDYINAQSGKHFDPSIVKVFMHLIQK